MVLLLMLPYNNLLTADTTTPITLHCMACLLEAWPVQRVFPRSARQRCWGEGGSAGTVMPGSKGVCCPVTPGHGSGIGYSAGEPPGVTPSCCLALLGHLNQLLASSAVTTIDMSNASNSTTCFCLSLVEVNQAIKA